VKKLMSGFIAALLVTFGCQVALTPEQQAVADKASAALLAAGAQVEVVQATLEKYIAEYKTIKAKIDAGESLPAVLVSRFAELQGLIKGGVADIQVSVAKVQEAKKALQAALDAGVKWYNSGLFLTLLGIIGGIAGTYFPVARPAIAAVQTMVQGVAEYNKVNPAGGGQIKKAILAKSRVLGTELSLDAMVQTYDPKKV